MHESWQVYLMGGSENGVRTGHQYSLPAPLPQSRSQNPRVPQSAVGRQVNDCKLCLECAKLHKFDFIIAYHI